MGFFGAMGKALKAPLKPINKAVGAIPGMGAVQRATPGMGAMAKNTGIGIQPQGPGVGPSNPMLSKFGMLGSKLGMNQPPQMGASMGQAPPPPPPPDMGASPDVMPPSGVEAPIPQQGPPPDQAIQSMGQSMGQGLAPRPSGFMQAMQRRNPSFRGRM